MTTLRPQLIRADTLDLQDHDEPSAKDHSRQPTHPGPLGDGPAAPHQNQALRHAEQEASHEQRFSPRVSPRVSEEQVHGAYPAELDFYDDPGENDLNGNHSLRGSTLVGDLEREQDDSEVTDQGDDDSLDEDLMDKISSSPSIDDGKYPLPIIWPPRRDSADSGATRSPFSTPTRGAQRSSSPFTSTPDYFPLSFGTGQEDSQKSHQGGYGQLQEADPTILLSTTSTYTNLNRSYWALETSWYGPRAYKQDAGRNAPVANDAHHFRFPSDDPALYSDFETAEERQPGSDDDDLEWEDDEDTLSSDDADSANDFGDFQCTNDSRFIDSGWGGECLRETEDIDFEFVYALHTFVATVEGQANASKGDTMVLLDDSNSYWWLVRVVKDGSIGYLPAEHIETPTERLARLNKHRNIDLSATMLGDNPEKSKNPLKKAMRRRNEKRVQFSAPQYFEPFEFDYSDEEEEEEEEEGQDEPVEPIQNGVVAENDEPPQEAKVEPVGVTPLRINTQQTATNVNGIHRAQEYDSMGGPQQGSPEKPKPVDTAMAHDMQQDASMRSRNGVVRNTDSFFKDETVETKKISLTPRLLRGDSDASVSQDQTEVRQRPSLETFDKMVADPDRPKEDKRKKEKKGMLSGLFKRKDKRSKPGESDNDESEKRVDSPTRLSPQSKDSMESSSGRLDRSPQRQPSKLQKLPPLAGPTKLSPTKLSPTQDSSSNKEGVSPNAPDHRNPISPQIQNYPDNHMQTSTREPSTTTLEDSGSPSDLHDDHKALATSPTTSPSENKSFFSPITSHIKPVQSNGSVGGAALVKAVYVKKTKHRFEIDDGDSESDSTPVGEPRRHDFVSPIDTDQSRHQHFPHRSGSPDIILPIEMPREPDRPPPAAPSTFVGDTSSTSEAPSMSPPSPAGSSSPSLVDIDTANDVDHSTGPTTLSPRTIAHTPSSARSTPTWSDASLRTYMENNNDIRDLLIIVHDKSNVVPAGPDHPFTGNLFANEKGRLAEMQTSLDSMLTSWLSRKNSSLLSK